VVGHYHGAFLILDKLAYDLEELARGVGVVLVAFVVDAGRIDDDQRDVRVFESG
jgi:hypothetical protein